MIAVTPETADFATCGNAVSDCRINAVQGPLFASSPVVDKRTFHDEADQPIRAAAEKRQQR